MKQFLFFIFALACICTNAKTYKPLFTDGKMWKGISIGSGETTSNTKFTVTVLNDTIIEGKTCKKLHFDVVTESGTKTKYNMIVYEDNENHLSASRRCLSVQLALWQIRNFREKLTTRKQIMPHKRRLPIFFRNFAEDRLHSTI